MFSTYTTTPRDTSDGMVTSRNEVRGPRKSAYCTVRSAPGGRIEHQQIEPPTRTIRGSPSRRANSLVARHVCESPGAALSNSSAADSGITEPIENTAMPFLVLRERDLVAARHEHRILDARHACLRGAVEVRVEDGDSKAAGAQRARKVQRQTYFCRRRPYRSRRPRDGGLRRGRQ